MTAEDAYIAMGCPGNEAAATKQNISLYQYEMALQHSGTSATVARALAGGNATPRTLGSSPHLPTPNQHAVPRIRIGVSEELSAYEKERQANIAQNNEQLVLLGLR